MKRKRYPTSERVQLAQIDASVKIHRSSERAKSLRSFLDLFKALIIVVGIGFFSYLCIKTLSGKTTSAEIVLKFLADIKFITSIGVGGSGMLYGFRQKKLREDHIKSTGKYIEKLEGLLNPDRESSNITETGQTQEEDK